MFVAQKYLDDILKYHSDFDQYRQHIAVNYSLNSVILIKGIQIRFEFFHDVAVVQERF